MITLGKKGDRRVDDTQLKAVTKKVIGREVCVSQPLRREELVKLGYHAAAALCPPGDWWKS